MEWINLAHCSDVVSACECGDELSGSVKCGEFCD
jgi:hypothetical protein